MPTFLTFTHRRDRMDRRDRPVLVAQESAGQSTGSFTGLACHEAGSARGLTPALKRRFSRESGSEKRLCRSSI
jgi:hypothetical protein